MTVELQRKGTHFLRLQGTQVFAAAAVTIILFALTPATTRIAITQIDGLSIGIIRTVGAGLITLPLLVVFRLPPPARPREWGLLLISAFGSFAAFPVLFSLGTQMTSGSHAALIMAVMPLFVGLTGGIINRRSPRFGWFVGAAIAIAGETALIGIRKVGLPMQATITGDAIVLAGCILFAVGAVAGAQLSSRMNPWAATFWAITLASIGLSPLAVSYVGTRPSAEITPATFVALLHVTIGATIFANVAWIWALSRGGVVRIAPLQFSQPVFALLFASILLHEELSPPLLLVAALIVAGIVVACRGAMIDAKAVEMENIRGASTQCVMGGRKARATHE
jgi:drug/metabolite transporter (DMT)-like permease